ncbi:MAG: DUF4129 domain-containing protein, partial [Thermoplasmata archaeon]
MAAPTLSAEAEVPHENYEYVSANINIVLMILNTSISYFESSLVALYYEDVSGGNENLSAVRSLLDPVENLIDEIEDIAESYDELRVLVPPFAELADEESAFVGMESSLIDARDVIRSLSGQVSLTDEETIQARIAINQASALISQMNATIDDMLVAADEIVSLSVDGAFPFADNDLIELIENLRNLLYMIEVELVDLIEDDDGPGDDEGISIEPFLTLWISDSSPYLGDDLTGGGVLFFNDSFRSGHDVSVLWDGSELVSAITGTFGSYGFDFAIPLNESWLGTHEMIASASTPFENLTSDPLTISVSMIPTSFVIGLSSQLLSPSENLDVSILLRDVREDGIADAEFNLTIDGETTTFNVDSSGRYSTTFVAADLSIGNHTLSATYDGGVPYLPCSSPEFTFKIDVPTTLELNPFIEKVYRGYYLVGNGTLVTYTLEPLPDMTIRLSIDGVLVQNATTNDDGVFTFSIATESMTVGTHLLTAEFLPENETWRSSMDKAEFRIYVTESTGKYPFWPIIPGWPGLGAPPEIVHNLFFGQYAYLGWLLVVGIIAVTVKTLRARKRTLARKTQRALHDQYALERGIPTADRSEALAEYADYFDLIKAPEAPSERIVWSYNYFLHYLSHKMNIQVRASMTHREIAKMLQAFGYPAPLVDKATSLYEMARYAGISMSESEMN